MPTPTKKTPLDETKPKPLTPEELDRARVFFEHASLALGFQHPFERLSDEQQRRCLEQAAAYAHKLQPAKMPASEAKHSAPQVGPVPIDPGAAPSPDKK